MVDSVIIQAMSCVCLLVWVHENIRKRYVSSVKGLPKFDISIEEILQVEYGTVSQWITGQRVN